MFDVHCFISPFGKIHCCVVSVASCVVAVVLCRLHKTESFSVGPSSFFLVSFSPCKYKNNFIKVSNWPVSFDRVRRKGLEQSLYQFLSNIKCNI